MPDEEWVRCDALGCTEQHPRRHEDEGQPCFTDGKWAGWLYLDLNRPDLSARPLRFCSVHCCRWWLDRNSMGLPAADPYFYTLKPDMPDQLAARRRKAQP